MISNGHLFNHLSVFWCFLLCPVVFYCGLVMGAWGQARGQPSACSPHFAVAVLALGTSSWHRPGTVPPLVGVRTWEGGSRAPCSSTREGFSEEQLKCIPVYLFHFQRQQKGESRVWCWLEHLQGRSAACSIRSALPF